MTATIATATAIATTAATAVFDVNREINVHLVHINKKVFVDSFHILNFLCSVKYRVSTQQGHLKYL